MGAGQGGRLTTRSCFMHVKIPIYGSHPVEALDTAPTRFDTEGEAVGFRR